MFRLLGAQALLVLLALLALPAVAAADHDPEPENCDTPHEFTEDKVLDRHYEQNSFSGTEPCIILSNGANLDLNGFTITCLNDGSRGPTCTTAIKATSPGSVVRDTEGDGGIRGSTNALWEVGVEEAQDTRDLVIEHAFVGVSGHSFVKKVRHNVLRDVIVCVDVTLNRNTSFVRDNYCRTDLVHPILVSEGSRIGLSVAGTNSGNGPRVDHNMVVGADGGIYGAGGKLRIEDNIVVDPDSNAYFSIFLNGPQTATDNICTAGRATLPYNSPGACPEPEAPFFLP